MHKHELFAFSTKEYSYNVFLREPNIIMTIYRLCLNYNIHLIVIFKMYLYICIRLQANLNNTNRSYHKSSHN